MDNVDLTTNISQIFTELYQNYNILDNPHINVFENSLYLEGKQATTIKKRMESSILKYHKKEGTLKLYLNPNQSLEDQVFIAGYIRRKR